MAAVTIYSDFEAPQNKVCHCFHISPSISHEVMGPDAMILVQYIANVILPRNQQSIISPFLSLLGLTMVL